MHKQKEPAVQFYAAIFQTYYAATLTNALLDKWEKSRDAIKPIFAGIDPYSC